MFRCVSVAQSASTANPNVQRSPNSLPLLASVQEVNHGAASETRTASGRSTTARQDSALLTKSISGGVWHLPCLAEAGEPWLRRTALGVRLAGQLWGGVQNFFAATEQT